MLPFFGKAHVAYIPEKKVVGISKLARLLDIHSRKFQIQERIGELVTRDIIKHLGAQGAACIIEAQHLCMKMRGVGKQHSIMTTSSMKGAFLEKPAARAELMALIK
jgi:GTP cyclohydrolase I